MDEERLIARFGALENVCVITLALCLANSRNDPDFSKAEALLAALERDGHAGMAHLSPEVQQEGRVYLSNLLRMVLRTIPALRGDDSGRQRH